MQETEKQFLEKVAEAAGLLRWHRVHFRQALTQSGSWMTPVQFEGAGFPDLVLVREDRLLFIEVKSAKGRLSEWQKEWITLLRGTGKCEVYVFFPEDWGNLLSILT